MLLGLPLFVAGVSCRDGDGRPTGTDGVEPRRSLHRR